MTRSAASRSAAAADPASGLWALARAIASDSDSGDCAEAGSATQQRGEEDWNDEDVSLALEGLDDVSGAHDRSESAGPLTGWPCSRGWSS